MKKEKEKENQTTRCVLISMNVEAIVRKLLLNVFTFISNHIANSNSTPIPRLSTKSIQRSLINNLMACLLSRWKIQ